MGYILCHMQNYLLYELGVLSFLQLADTRDLCSATLEPDISSNE